MKFTPMKFTRRITPLTWCIWLLLVADLLEPGYLRFNLLVVTVDASAIASEVRNALALAD